MCLQCKRLGFNPWMGKIPWRRAWQPTPAFLPGKIPETEEPGELKESDMTERLSHTHTHTHTHTRQMMENYLARSVRRASNSIPSNFLSFFMKVNKQLRHLYVSMVL